jgi:hypothetical protein
MRQEFERHRYVTKLKTADVLIFNSHSEFQVREDTGNGKWEDNGSTETLELTVIAGNAQFLETADARAKVLPS